VKLFKLPQKNAIHFKSGQNWLKKYSQFVCLKGHRLRNSGLNRDTLCSTGPLCIGFILRQLLAVGAEHVGVVVSGILAARQVEGHVEEDDDGKQHAQDESSCLLLNGKSIQTFIL